MAAHRELWHKGLQRRALLTRKLGLAKYSRASERLSAQKATAATHISLEPESGWPFRA